jgi:hypothetical protein
VGSIRPGPLADRIHAQLYRLDLVPPQDLGGRPERRAIRRRRRRRPPCLLCGGPARDVSVARAVPHPVRPPVPTAPVFVDLCRPCRTALGQEQLFLYGPPEDE